MNKFIWIVLIGFLAAGCSSEEATEAPAEAAATIEELEPEAEISAALSTEDTATTTQSLEVVEESAAEAEPKNQPIVLAQAEDAAAARTWKYKEGKNFTRMVPTQPTVGGADQIEVAEVFMYSCPHCDTLESYINRWAENKNPNVRFVRIPAIFNQLARLHAQLYYTEVILAKNGKLQNTTAFRSMVFDEFHRRNNRLTSEATIQRLFTRAGVSEDDFKRTWGSFEVDQALRVAQDLARRYGIASVPMVIVNGKYRTDVGMAGGPDELMEVIDELTEREGLR